MTQTKIAIIGGSGIYDIEGLEGAEWLTVESPWGAPSDAILTGTLGGLKWHFCRGMGAGMFIHHQRYPTVPTLTR